MKRSDFEKLLHDVTCDIMKYTVNSERNRVRYSYPLQGQPAWSKDEDYIFISAFLENAYYNNAVEHKYTKLGSHLSNYTQVYTVQWVFYGEKSMENALRIRLALLSKQQIKLAANKIYPVTDIQNPRRVPELFQGNWHERCDLTVQFYIQVAETETTEYFASAEVEVKTERND